MPCSQLTLQLRTTLNMHCKRAHVPGGCRSFTTCNSRLLATGRRPRSSSLHWLFCLHLDVVTVTGAAPSRICQRLLRIAAAGLA